jgi:hypothetical protein
LTYCASPSTARLAGYEDVNGAGRLVKHARYYGLPLAEGDLPRQLFASMAHRIAALPVAAA